MYTNINSFLSPKFIHQLDALILFLNYYSENKIKQVSHKHNSNNCNSEEYD